MFLESVLEVVNTHLGDNEFSVDRPADEVGVGRWLCRNFRLWPKHKVNVESSLMWCISARTSWCGFDP